MDAILRLDEQNLEFYVESGEKLPDDAINSIIAAYGPLTEDILWEEKGSGDAEADERLLREVDAKKARMVAFLIDYALSKVEDKVSYHKYIVITSQTSRLFTKH